MTGPTDTLTVIKAAAIFDAVKGDVQSNMAVIVEDGKIKQVLPQHQLSFPDGRQIETYEYPNSMIVPGLVDCHTHSNMPGNGLSVNEVDEDTDDIHLLEGVKSARIALESGVTTVRDNGGWHKVVFSLKEGIRRQIVPGPRIVASGRPITMTGGHCWMMGAEADGVEGVRTAVRQLVHEGADFIKVMASGGTTHGSMPERPSYTLEELTALTNEAHLRGKLVAAHAHSMQSIINCLDAGLDMIIHCTFIQPDGTIQYEPWLGERIAAAGVWVNPTLHVARSNVTHYQNQHEGQPSSREGDLALEALKIRAEERAEVCRQLGMAGARLIGGSDCGWGSYPFGQFHMELDAMADAGLSYKQALLAGTHQAAASLGIANIIGSIEQNKEADLVLINGDPTTNIKDLAQVEAVFKGGIKVR